MKNGRISSHDVNHDHVGSLQPIAARIRIYVDSFRSQIIARQLYDVGQAALGDHLTNLSSSGEISQKIAEDVRYQSIPENTSRTLAIIFGYAMARLELRVVSSLEDKARANGISVVPNSHLVNASNPMKVEVGDAQGNILQLLSGMKMSEKQRAASCYLDVSCDGIVFAPEKVDRRAETEKLQRRLRRCSREEADFIRTNLEAIPLGRFQPLGRQDWQDFEFSEKFVDELADQIGSFSRHGRYNVCWGYKGGLKEKGVDCDLIMKVMEDLLDESIDAFVFITHDGDFAPLLRRIQEADRPVFVGGLISGNAGRVSGRLMEVVEPGSFIDLGGNDFAAFVASMFMLGAQPDAMKFLMQWDQLS